MESNPTKPGWTRPVLLVLSLVLLGFCTFSYWGRNDLVAAVTVFPAWVWLVPGLLLVFAARRRGRRRFGVAVVALWLTFLLFFSDTPTSLLRSLLPPHSDQEWQRVCESGRGLRVISLNCNSLALSATEVKAYSPDIVLLQESPGRADVEKLAFELFGDEGITVWSGDPSIVARGQIITVEQPQATLGDFVITRVLLPQGIETDIVSLRLVPSTFRIDLWNPDCWAEFTENRQRRRSELKRLLSSINASRSDRALIVGGDFNAPPGDAVFRLLPATLSDPFERAGVGWGNTIINEFAFLRIDRIWTTNHFRPFRVEARRTNHSDHRMVICDMEILSPSPAP